MQVHSGDPSIEYREEKDDLYVGLKSHVSNRLYPARKYHLQISVPKQHDASKAYRLGEPERWYSHSI